MCNYYSNGYLKCETPGVLRNVKTSFSLSQSLCSKMIPQYISTMKMSYIVVVALAQAASLK